jgi:hypothetical protein
MTGLCSETGQNFADGNLASTHKMFMTDHNCNRFCKFFHLECLHKQSLHPDSIERLSENQQKKMTPLFISTAKSEATNAILLNASGCQQADNGSSI